MGISKNNITVIIPCRKGSQRVKNKNFKKFANSSLLEIKLKQAKKLDLPIVINSDSKVAEQLSKKYNVKFNLRPSYFASSQCNGSEHYEYLANSVTTEYLMILQTTAPLITNKTINNCLAKFSENINDYDSLITVQHIKKHTWYDGKPLNYDLKNAVNSQDLKNITFPTFGVIICKTESLKKCKNVITNNCLFYPIDDIESIEIDTNLEFEISELLYKKNYND